MIRVFIVGVGMTRLGRLTSKSIKALTEEAVELALRDGSVPKHAVDAAWFSNTRQGLMEGQNSIRGQCALQAAGFEELPIVNLENACASSSTGLNQAVNAVRAGSCRFALVVGAEKMYYPERSKEEVLQTFLGGTDIERIEEARTYFRSLGASCPAVSTGGGRSTFFMEMYAAFARQHMQLFGTTQRQIAAAAAKNHWHSTMNPLAQYQHDMSIEAVLEDQEILWPLTRAMCAPVSDGAAAAVVCAEDVVPSIARSRAVEILASVLVSGAKRGPEEFQRAAGRRAANRAYEAAAVSPKDIDLAEVHDATAFAEIQQVENLGFCSVGDGGPFVERGHTRLGGSIPVNPSGGLVSKGHPVAATGIIQIHELVLQLRGEAGARQVANARNGLAENGGGFIGVEEAATVVTLLGGSRLK